METTLVSFILSIRPWGITAYTTKRYKLWIIFLTFLPPPLKG